jgi:predicted phosphohydrolase
MKIWAIGDLHLGFSTGKWMDIFGPRWKDHHLKVEEAWRQCVQPEDIVLMPGDFSWAMKPEEVAVDFRWFAALPGRKVLIKGNHDYWWPGSHRKLAELLPSGVYALKKRALVLDGQPLVGVRGADFLPRNGEGLEDVDARLRRERHELALSLGDLAAIYQGQTRPIALFHYPPFPMGRSESFFTRMLEDAGCSDCIFGHLHTEAEWQRVFQGERRGVTYRLVSCDALDFRPFCLGER